MAKSIISNAKECFLCREEADRICYFGVLPSKGLHKHHIMFGTANRKLSEKDGLWVYVCEHRHHEHGAEAPHESRETDLHLKQTAQRAYEKLYGHEAWMERYGKNYLD